MADFLETARANKLENAFLIGVHTQRMPEGEAAELLLELTELVENLRLKIVKSTLVNLRQRTPALLLGSGKAAELVAEAKAAGADVIVFDETLSPAQQRNWEELFGGAVIDRQEVIRVCVEEGVPIYQGKIDKYLFQVQLQALGAMPQQH